MECIFCKIANKELNSNYIYEDENVMGVLDIHPLTTGHVFVIPKKHYENILHLTEEEVLHLWRGIVEVEKMLMRAFSPDGFTIGINQGKEAGQAIDHLHIHVIPRKKNDGGGSIHSIFQNPKAEENLEEVKKKILESNK
jgi:histidine triad (HIT) family protein